MNRTIHDPIASEAPAEKRQEIQDAFGRHLVQQRNRMALLVKKWIETDAPYPIPLYDQLLDRVKKLDPLMRADVASIALLMADEIAKAILATFAKSDDLSIGSNVVNYAIIAQIRHVNADDVIEEIDVNRGSPVIAIWDMYKRWLSRYAPSDLRARVATSTSKEEINDIK